MEAVRQRFGKGNEQFFTWLSLPTSVIYSGLWLNGLAVFLHAIFGFDLKTTIIVTGVIVVFNSTLGGSWAVVSSDFMQTVILMLIALTTAIYSFVSVGGVGEIVRQFPTESWAFGNGINYPVLAVLWIFLMFFKQFTATSSVAEAPKYLYAKDSRHARWAAIFATHSSASASSMPGSSTSATSHRSPHQAATHPTASGSSFASRSAKTSSRPRDHSSAPAGALEPNSRRRRATAASGLPRSRSRRADTRAME
jgi:Na+/proline symporter